MSLNPWKDLGIALIFVVIFLSGYWLSRSGKPYSMLVLTVHKLLAVGTFVYLIVTLIRANRADTLHAYTVIAGVVSGVFFLSLIATGGLLSSEVQTPAFVSTLHKVAPYLTLLSTAVTLYLLVCQTLSGDGSGIG
jgi:hypothetical protein